MRRLRPAGRVGESPALRFERAGELLLLLQLAQIGLLFLHVGERGDAENVVLDRVAEAVDLEDEVERLVPRNFLEDQRHAAADSRVHHHIQPGDVREQTENVL